tara:strand:- start:176 stop:457 length:282 start_codon:yes stop_codon:yes gene_type:complete
MSLHATPAIQPQPDRKFIPAGKFIDIDAKYYRPQDRQFFLKHESFGSQGKPLQSHTIRYDQPQGFVKLEPVLGLGPLIVNYGSYIYQQRTGFQ